MRIKNKRQLSVIVVLVYMAVLVLLFFNSCKTVDRPVRDLHEMSKAAGMAETSQLKNVEKLLVPILKKNPDWGEGWIYLGRSLAAQGKYAEGAAAVEKGGNLGERRTSVWLEACSMARKGGDEQLALKYLERGLRENIHRPWLIEPSSFDGFLDLGDFLDTDSARKLLLEASKKRPSLHPDLVDLDRKFLAQKKTLEPEQVRMMVQKYISTIEDLPEDGELYYRLGKIHVKFGNYKEALESFQRSKELNYIPVFNDGWLAHVNAQLGNKDEAFAHLERNLAVMDTPDWIFYPGEFDPLQDDPRWKEMVDKYRPSNTPFVQIPEKDQGSIPYPTKNWSRTDPAKVGINQNKLTEASKTIEKSFPNAASLLVVRNGHLVFERYFNGYTDKDAFNMKSATKSFTSTAAGIMFDQGILRDVNTPIVKILPEYFKDIDDPMKQQITVKHLLTMTAGLDWVEGEEKAENLFLTGNYAQLILKEKLLHKPGEVYEYSSAVSHLLAVSLSKLSGQDLLSYTQEHLFDPIGITPEFWAQDLNGYYLGDGELRLRPQDLAKFGLLILRGGKWDGKSVVSTEWVRNATANQVREARGPHTSYGYQFWVLNVGGHRVIKAAGYGGQRCWIIPSLDMVVVVTSEPLTPDNDPDAILGQWIIPSVKESKDKE